MRIRTGYSFKTAAGKIEAVIDRLKELGWESAPITDRLSTFGFNRWNKACEKHSLRPIFGVELATVPRRGATRQALDFWTYLATKELEPLHKLIALATESHDREPNLTYKEAVKAKGVIKIIGEHVQLDAEIEGFKLKPAPDLYVALSPSLPVSLYRKLSKKGFQFIMCSDNYYPRKEDKEYYRVLLGKAATTQTYPQYILSTDEWLEAVWFASDKDKKAAMLNFRKVQKQCTAKMVKADLLVPEKKKTLRQMCIDGAKRTGTDLTNKVYKERLEKELKLIAEKKFEDYFYIIADLVSFARKKMIVGPARGSSCGSLVCYLLDITTVDPIPFGLIFERFIDINRTDLPDIDIDFSDKKRKDLFEYAEKKYGKDHVARLGTVSLFMPKSVLNAAGASLRVPKWMTAKVADSLVERSSGDSRAMLALEDTLQETDMGKKLLEEYPEFKIASDMEGHPNNASQHAAGIVITNNPITKFVALDSRTKSAMCDKKDAEDLNLLKIDALGLTQLSIFERTLELIGEPNVSGWLEKLPLDDPKAFDVLNRGYYAGIFQFTGKSLQIAVKRITVDKLEDMITITALARPGPIATGGAADWANRRTGLQEVTTVHPMLTELTKDTYGIVVYQEQVMNIVRTLGKMSWEDTSTIRKAMSKSLGDEFFEKYWQKFRKGAAEQGIEEKLAKSIWDQVNKFGCLSGDTIIDLADVNQHSPRKITIKQLYYNRGRAKIAESSSNRSAQSKRPRAFLYSVTGDKVHNKPAIRKARLNDIWETGVKTTWLLSAGRYKIRATSEHKFLTPSGWKNLGQLSEVDFIAVKGSKHKSKRWKNKGSGHHNVLHGQSKKFLQQVAGLKKKFKLCQKCKKRPYQETHHIDGNRLNNEDWNLLPVCRKCHKSFHDIPERFSRGWEIKWEKIKSITRPKKEMTYDISMEPEDNYVANGIVTHNSWAFNRSHAVAYGIISYWCCWLKAYHPLEFAAATLDAESNPIKQIDLLRELSREGIGYVAVDPERSGERWEINKEEKLLLGPLTQIKGIGPAALDEILCCRRDDKPIRAALMKRLVNAETEIDSLYPVRDRIKKLHPKFYDQANTAPVKDIIDVQCGWEGDVIITALAIRIVPRDENDAQNVQKRGRKVSGPTQSLSMFLRDDTDEIYCKIDRYLFEDLAPPVLEIGRQGKSLYAVKGTVPAGFRMIKINKIRYLGDLKEDEATTQ